ncbi:hypothetical protein F4778DRAFT_784884 [Xylariomycetidae sp. FL2044]|nr:hypothetical protein F4778DRAFT_784884 [Xylariomycetidae sp. FL2044]
MSSYGNDTYDNEAPSGRVTENSYVSRPGHKSEEVPVVSDQERIEDPVDGVKADTDEQLTRDDNDAIDSSNIMEGGRTRGAAKPSGTYREPGDDEGLPENDGRSSTRRVVPE